MYEKPTDVAAADRVIHPLKSLTRAQFAALGGDAVAYLRPVTGAVLGTLIEDAVFEAETEYQLLMAANGTPLLVTDTEDSVNDWLGENNLGLATLH
ncbi:MULTISPECIES: DUF1150 family protein [Devosia]|uniref:DUF1150 family protein n=1 Tax=Devosia TaxID=46913 RepID=UPI0027333FE0|nr:DUF1150 family protein [Devosia sp.]MDP2779339.1 DUF1150 family protein [Devosia sp.]HLV83110.1 DUF1150 family protein [Devosia sp.]